MARVLFISGSNRKGNRDSYETNERNNEIKKEISNNFFLFTRISTIFGVFLNVFNITLFIGNTIKIICF